ncbi:MAG TPA: DNA polymerase III subunit delta [Bryobacteraceae bacterium]|nr:DNA polymerase III subunit delta [Bryobacteraceae bacterium]
MSPDEFLRSLDRRIEPAYLFLGPEMSQRDRCRRVLIERCLPPEDRESGFSRYDLDEVSLTTVLDDARSMSLFASNRLIWASSAEGALPRRVTASSDDDEGGAKGDAGILRSYVDDASLGTVLVLDCSRYDTQGEDKAKLQRVQKYFSAIKAVVEFEALSPAQARQIVVADAKALGLKIGRDEIDLLLEVLGSDALRIRNELEKLSLLTGTERAVTKDDIVAMVPDARATSIFALVNAIGRKDREAALEALDLLVRDGEYLALALTFLGTQFRMALAAKEAGLTNPNAVQSHFTKLGTQMWRSRAEQVSQTASAFTLPKLRSAVQKIHDTDRALRDARPDDRTVLERLVIEL